MIVRPYHLGDEQAFIDLFRRSVREVAPSKYSHEQVEAWIGNLAAASRIRERASERETYVAEENTRMLGWIEMTTDGHLDVLYCAPEATRKGVADALYATVLKRAHDLALKRLHTEASYFAESFFRRHGWVLEEREVIVRSGISIPRARMQIILF